MTEVNLFKDSKSPFTGKNKYAVFVGRWQPLHFGHIWLINQKLEKNIPVLMMIRDIEPDDKNPFTTLETKKLIEKAFEGKNVKTLIIPDIESVNWGRGVGYEVNQFDPPESIKMISATSIRDSIKENRSDWKSYVPESIQNDIEKYLINYYGVEN